ncbi:MAG: D-alanyl-D-alanine carboxypeptidase [Alphaproteobacteria bacterium]|nr:D-alanyl-D-alanine carboxypeptidase [Alphaproteobacteria bacterium]
MRVLFRLALMGLVILACSGRAGHAAANYSSIVIEQKTGAVLHAVNPDTRHYPASLTKMMTLYLVFEALQAKRFTLDSRIRVSRRAARQPASKLGLKPRQTISVRQVILALAIRSANDVASAIAEAMAGTERKFGRLMSAKARALGMTNTRFRNASGLPHRRQLTTARDIAILAQALRRDFPRYYGYFRVRTFTFRGRRMENHNRLLDRYAGADGIKTGFIHASGFNLAASAERDGIRLIAVVLGTRSPRARDLHTMGLLERGFEKATRGRYRAYQYDRNIHVTRQPRRINKRIRVYRAPGARGRIRLSRLTPPRRRGFLSLGEQGSAAAHHLSTGRSSRSWAVRIGTFTRTALAELALTGARRRLPRLLAGARHRIRPIVIPGKTLYRAEFVGLERASAQRICARLKARGQACLVLASGAGATAAR